MKLKIRQWCQGLFAMVALTGAGAAMADYKVWYYDDNGWFNHGDLSDGNTKMVPPAWACGRRFFDPSYYRWVGEYNNTIDSDDFDEDVHVWLPLGGACPEDDLFIEDKDGGQSYDAPLGTHYMEISTNYGSYWIDKNGGWPACNCALPLGFTTLVQRLDWFVVPEIVDDVKLALVAPSGSAQTQRTALLLDDAARRFLPMERELSRVVSERRRQSFGAIESSVRSLEDQALAAAARVSNEIPNCRRHLLAGRNSDAYVACDATVAAAQTAQRALLTIRREIEH